jgi:hypothetical protein
MSAFSVRSLVIVSPQAVVVVAEALAELTDKAATAKAPTHA